MSNNSDGRYYVQDVDEHELGYFDDLPAAIKEAKSASWNDSCYSIYDCEEDVIVALVYQREVFRR